MPWRSAALTILTCLAGLGDIAASAADPPRLTERALLWEGTVPAKPAPPPKGLRQPRRALVPLAAAPFPFNGTQPRTNEPFFDVAVDGQRGRTLRTGEVRWEAVTYSDNRTLLHLPAGFDPRQPILIVLYLHGNGATLERDVEVRQQVPRQVAAAGLNTALVAPQFAVDAPDSSPGKFGEPRALERFLDETSRHLAMLAGHARYTSAFTRARVVIVAYSGGYLPAAWLLAHGGARNRITGVVILDGLYAEQDLFADFLTRRRKAFFVSAYGPSSEAGNTPFRTRLEAMGLRTGHPLAAGSAAGRHRTPERRQHRRSRQLRDRGLDGQSHHRHPPPHPGCHTPNISLTPPLRTRENLGLSVYSKGTPPAEGDPVDGTHLVTERGAIDAKATFPRTGRRRGTGRHAARDRCSPS